MREGFKKTVIGDIPIDWDVKKLIEVSEFSNGKGHEQSIDENGQYIVVNSKFISTEGLVRKFSNQKLSPLIIGDICMVMSDIPNGKAIAKCFLIDENNRYTLNQRICSIKAKESCESKFMFYVLNRNRYYLAFDNGVGQTNLRKDEVIDCPIQVPPLPEQQIIAEILSTVDDKIDVIDQQISETQALKKGLMQRLLTKGIGHTEFKDSALGEIPESWEMERLDNICPFIQDGTHFSPKSKEGAFKYITSKNIKFGRLDLSNCSFISKEEHDVIYKKCKVLKGDILLTKDGAKTGNVCINPLDEPFSLLSSVAVLRCNPKLALNQFLFQLILSDNGQKLIQDSMAGQAITRITLAKISAFQFPIPNIDEQNEISEILSSVDEKLELLSDKKTCYQELKQGLMQQLLTGKVRVAV